MTLKKLSGAGRRLTSLTQSWVHRRDRSRLSPQVVDVIDAVRRENLTFHTDEELVTLAKICAEVEAQNIQGVIIEAGCARGGSSLVMAAAKRAQRPLWIYDVFGMIPPPSDADGEDMRDRYETISSGEAVDPGGGKYYAYEEDLLARITESFIEYGYSPDANAVEFSKGLVQETLRLDVPVSVGHIDVDWYEPVLHSLGQIVPNLSVGGSVVLHAYFDWSGCRRATDEYFAQVRPGTFKFENRAGLRIARRTAAA